MDLLAPSDKRTRCPYKGEAVYWSVKANGETVKDIVWSYPDPILECLKISGMFCFFNERVDAIYVDVGKMPTPNTV